MLAYFHHVQFYLQESHSVRCHLLFRQNLDDYFLASTSVNSCTHNPKSSCSQQLFALIIFFDVSLACGLLDCVHPYHFLHLALEVILPYFIFWKNKFEGVEHLRIKIISSIFQEDSYKTMHCPMCD